MASKTVTRSIGPWPQAVQFLFPVNFLWTFINPSVDLRIKSLFWCSDRLGLPYALFYSCFCNNNTYHDATCFRESPFTQLQRACACMPALTPDFSISIAIAFFTTNVTAVIDTIIVIAPCQLSQHLSHNMHIAISLYVSSSNCFYSDCHYLYNHQWH